MAKATHAGLPWLLHLRRRITHRVHFWPFDGWHIPVGRSVVAEVHPPLWSGRFPRASRNPSQHRAYSTAEWMRKVDENNSLAAFFNPDLESVERKTAEIEGWFLGLA